MRVTLRDIAKRVNLSHATVSFVLNERMDVSIPPATRQRVLEAAKEMGYRPNRAAQALVRGRTNMVALWLPYADSGQYARAQIHLAARAAEDGFELITRLYDLYRAHTASTWLVDDWPVDGVLVLDCHRAEFGDAEPSSEAPLVSFGAFYHADQDHVAVDFGPGTEAALLHLLQSKCSRVAYLTCDAADAEEPKGIAYRAACAAHRLEPEVIVLETCSRTDARVQVQNYVAARGKPDAIIAQRDDLALAARRGLADSGLGVPGDVLMVGFDGSEEGECAYPSLTSITPPYAEMCDRAWAMLTEHIHAIRDRRERDPKARSQVVTATLEIRESSVRPSA